MVDVVDTATRGRMMSGIRSRDTRPEMLVRSLLHARGFRYRVHAKELPAKPDIVLPRWRAVVLVNGCFWHGHDCHLFKLPATRKAFWLEKITKNAERDQRNVYDLQNAGWRTGTVYECALKGRARRDSKEIGDELARWIRSDVKTFDIAGLSTVVVSTA